MNPTEALLVLIGIIILFYVSAGLIWQWWSGEVADRTETERDDEHTFHGGWK